MRREEGQHRGGSDGRMEGWKEGLNDSTWRPSISSS